MVERVRSGRDDRDDRDRGRGSDRGRSSGGGKWRYEPQSVEDINKRASRTGGRFDSIFKQGFDSWRPKAGDNLIRFLPGTWGLGVHYAYDIWTHRNIGADDSTYLCLDKMLGKFCPICEAAAEAKRARDEEEAKALRSVEQKVAWILDREGDVKTSPLLFAMSWTMDRDILSLTQDKRRNQQLWIDNPTEGYDVTIKRSGTGLNTRYFGMAIDRSPSPIADKERDADKIMDYIGENQIPDVLNYYDAEYIEKVLSGTSGPRDDAAEPRGRERERDDKGGGDREEARPRSLRRERADEPDPERTSSRRGSRDEPEPEREEPRRGRRDEPEPETRRGRGRDEPEPERDAPRRGRDRDEPDDRAPRRAAREEARDDERDPDRDGRGRREPDDAPSRRARGGNGREDDDEVPFDGGGRRTRADEDEDRRSRRDDRDEPAPRRGARSEDDEDRRPTRRR